MFYRENGQFKTSYRSDQQIFPIAQDRWAIAAIIAFAFIGVPLLADEYLFRAILIPFVILALAAIGVNILVGYCGQISLGSGAFMAVGAYMAYNTFVRIEGMPLILALLSGGFFAMLVGVFFGIPSLRVKGLYLAVATLAALSLFFQKTATGRALRAVADDHQAAQSIGIPLARIWVIVWCVAGVVALVAGMIWGSKLGVQFSLTTVALRALPVVILGGLTSVPGAIIGGLIIGVGEKLSEVFLGPYVGGGIEIWFAYVLALVFLLFRPQGLFGEKIIDRV